MGIPGFTAQASLYASLGHYVTLPGSGPDWTQPVLAAMPKGGWHGPDCVDTCGPPDSFCRKTCTVSCHPGQVHTYVQSLCSATEGCCGGKCVDIEHDPNCGFCGKKCSDSGLTCCEGECVHLHQSTRNCGKCGHDCRPGSCEDGVCKCPSGSTCGGICC